MQTPAETGEQPPLNVNFWEQHYQEGRTRWDLGQPAPPFVSWLKSTNAPPPGKAIVLGSGRGYEAMLFAEQGFEVTAVDFAPSAIADASQIAADRGLSIQFLQRDIFDLVPEFAGQFDYVIEHTCFCAIDPSLRPAYLDLVTELLKPGGELLAIFFTHGRPGGPPFGSTPEQIQQLFEPRFTVMSLRPVTNSVEARRGEEHVGHLHLKTGV
ncbi:MAG: methyltransferase domain-containing protein [Cyanobacteria bacterium Co-bin13]|nr:methyltransferase domain-containing protein [Cyanobacteria bacterium Co-bin13]